MTSKDKTTLDIPIAGPACCLSGQNDFTPLSIGQQALWFIYREAPESVAYNMGLLLRFETGLDTKVLKRSLQRLTARHSMLHSRMGEVDGVPCQWFDAGRDPVFRLWNAADWDQDTLMDKVRQVSRQPFVLEEAVFRVDGFLDADQGPLLLLGLHHIAGDARSMAILGQEICTLYNAEAQGKKGDLPSFVSGYADYVQWEKELLDSEAKEKMAAYWLRQLAGKVSILQLPTDRPRPPKQTFNGASLRFALPAELTLRLRALARQEHCSLFSVLLTAFQILLHRYTGQEEILLGVPTSTVRGRTEFDDMVGYLVNPMVVHTSFPTGEQVSFRERTGLNQRQVLTGLYHQPYPFPLLMEQLQPIRDPRFPPLIQALISYEPRELIPQHFSAGGIAAENIALDQMEGQFDVSLTFEEEDHALSGILSYNADLFLPETALRMSEHLQVLLNSISDTPDRDIISLPMLTKGETQQLIDWNITATDWPTEATIVDLFERQVEKTPSAIAVVFEEERLTYRQLNERANQLAHYLVHYLSNYLPTSTNPAQTGNPLIAIAVERSLEMVVGLLGILKAGAGYLPIDPAYPRERIRYMLADSDAALLLTQTGLKVHLPMDLPIDQVVCLDEDGFRSQPTHNPAIKGYMTNVAYVNYTSGSTGQPKGVLIPHQAVVRLVKNTNYARLDSEQTFLQYASLSFDAATLEIWGPLLNGARLVVMPARQKGLASLAAVLAQEKITILFLTTSLFNLMLEEHPLALRDVKQLFTGGEVMSLPHIQMALRLLPNTELTNAYGPTENTTFTTCYPITDQLFESAIPIGSPIANSEVFIVDPYLQPVPAGIPGELVIGGAGLARGYLNRPRLTAEKFIEIELLGKTRRIYKTGDLARQLPCGNIEFLGRMDNQVKLRGFRIELGEVESALAQLAHIKQAVVTLHEADGDKRLVAYLTLDDTPEGDRSADPADLRDRLKRQLPDYMIPSHFMVLEKLPLTASGKTDRKALPAPWPETGNSGTGEKPVTSTEAILAGLWTAILRCNTIHRHDNFFDLGGHSLTATRLIARIRDNFQVELQVSTVFDHPRLDELARAIEAVGRTAEQPPIPNQPEDPAQVLSFAQQRLWFLNQLENSDKAVYNMPLALELSGPLNVQALEHSLSLLVQRHDSLRSSFPTRDGLAKVQILALGDREVLTIHDLTTQNWTGLPDRGLDEEIQNRSRNHACHPFDLDRGPLFKADLLQLTEQRWVLLLNFHHIISDGWSMGVFMRDCQQAYTAFATGAEPDLPPLAVQYGDYAAWQRKWLQGEVLQRQEAFWHQQMAGAPELLALPTDTPRPPRQSFRGNSYFHRLSPILTKTLIRLSRKQNVSLFMTLLSTFYILLSRYCRVDDLCVGTPIANRTNSDTHDTIGFFVNTLVLRGRLHSEMHFTDLLQQTRKTCLDAYAHQDIPFEMLVEQLQPTRSLSHGPLIQVLLGLQNNDPVCLDLPNIETTALDVEFPFSKFDVYLDAEERDGELHCRWEYAADLFHESTIQQMAAHFEVLLAAIAENPDQAVGNLPMLTTKDKQTWLTWNDTAAKYPKDKTIVDLFERQVEKTPDSIAVVFEGRRLTYRQLNEKANQLAHYLCTLKRNNQIRDNQLIAISAAHSLETMVGLLGILKAGGAYVPIDPDYPASRIRHMLKDCAAPLLLTQSKDRLPLEGMQPHCLPVYLDEIDFTGLSLGNPGVEQQVTDLAYINYTSGSTGQPKGVSIPHQAVVRLVKKANYARLDPEQTFLQYAPVSFDAATIEIWGALLNGARLVIMPARQKDLASLAAVLAHEKITILFLTTSLFNLMLDEHPGALGGVKQLLTGGEVMSVPHIQKALYQLPDTQLINVYGPTENTTFTTYYPIVDQVYGSAIPIGRPIANTEVFIVDPNLQPVPAGVPGELVTGGPGLARGYLNRPGLTAKKFIETQLFGKTRRIYRTGDLARLLPCGDIEFLGRIDHQVKLRGFRIELGEIETVLGQLPFVKEACVTLHEADGDKKLVAYLTLNESPNGQSLIDTANLRDRLKKQLPDYMIPIHFMALEKFPLTPNGKIDRKALPLPRPETAAGDTPATPTEAVLAGLWGTILRRDTIHRHDNFFNLGGHSLSATRLISRIRDNFKVELQVSAVFEHPRLDDLARAIEAAGGTTGGTVGLPLIRKQPKDTAPVLSFAQQRLWFLNQLEDGDTAVYNMPAALELSGRLNTDALQRSLVWLVQRHDSLRSSFPTQNGEAAVQIHAPGKREVLVIHDLTTQNWAGLPAQDLKKEIRNRSRCHANHTFNLGRGPLFKADLLQLPEQKWVLLLNFHHIISDGWSMGVFMRDWQQAYTAFARGNAPNLPPLAVQYGDYAVWQREWLQGEVLQRQETYWHQQLAGAPEMLELPLDNPRPPLQSFQGDHYLHSLPPDLTKDLNALSRKLNVSLFMMLLTAFYILLFRYSRMDDVCVGTPIANRTHSSTDDLIGFFVNTLVLRGRHTPEQSVADLLAQTRKTCLAAYTHQDIPFEMLVERLQPSRSLSHSPLFQVMFGLQNTDPVSPDLPGVEVSILPVEYPIAKFDLSVNAEELNGELQCWWEYATDLFHASTIHRMADHFETLLRAMVDNPAQPVSHLPMATDKDMEALRFWNDTAVDDPEDNIVVDLEDNTVVSLFQLQVEKTPDNIAVIFEQTQLTYRQLNERANQTAHYLRSLPRTGESRNPLIAICMKRSPEMVISILAILKSGGAYVPVDPTYPRARILHILDDSAVSLVLTQNILKPRLPLEELKQDCVAVCLDDMDLTGRSRENPAIKKEANDLAYVIYTSGTTGTPKGVMIQHSALGHYIRLAINDYALTSHDRILQFASPSFDTAVEEIHMTLLAGGALILRTQEMIGSTEAFLTACARYELTVLDLPTAYWHSLLTDMQAVQKLWPKSIRLVVIGGEAVSPGRASQWLEHFGDFPVLLNSYGPSEATVAATAFPITSSNTLGLAAIPIGRPFPNTRIYIMDEHLHPQPPGVPGELCIAGTGLALGYLNRPELTADKFIEMEILGLRERIYKTGDLARWLADGNIQFLSRIDHQVKLRGFRIELGEIESVLCRHQAVGDSVVVLYEQDDHKQLVAYVTEEGTQSFDEVSFIAQLREWLKENLPDYMVPAHFIVLDALPLTPNGKVDRAKLPAPDISGLTLGYEAPSTPAEEIVADIWAQVLGLERVGRHDNFFALGGHSLLVIQLVNRVQSLFDVKIVVRELFEAPTVAGITQKLIDHEPQKGQVDAIARLQKEIDQMSEEEIRTALGDT